MAPRNAQQYVFANVCHYLTTSQVILCSCAASKTEQKSKGSSWHPSYTDLHHLQGKQVGRLPVLVCAPCCTEQKEQKKNSDGGIQSHQTCRQAKQMVTEAATLCTSHGLSECLHQEENWSVWKKTPSHALMKFLIRNVVCWSLSWKKKAQAWKKKTAFRDTSVCRTLTWPKLCKLTQLTSLAMNNFRTRLVLARSPRVQSLWL